MAKMCANEAKVVKVQKQLEETIFYERRDSYKAAGRALGTIQEIIVYFLFEAFELGDRLNLEYPLPEYGRLDIVHNVEFSVHPLISKEAMELTSRVNKGLRFPAKLKREYKEFLYSIKSSVKLLEKNKQFDRETIIINPCYITNISQWKGNNIFIGKFLNEKEGLFLKCLSQPIAFIECKRVGLEQGTSTGPQTIEKAKQSSYVALRCSKLQKLFTPDGVIGYLSLDKGYEIDEYDKLWIRILKSKNRNLLKNIIRSIIFISNHINWYVDGKEKKDLHIINQSHDWSIWLKDDAISEFVNEFLLPPGVIRNTFYNNYVERKKGGTFFTKKRLDKEVYQIFLEFFTEERDNIAANWLEILNPVGKTFKDLIIEIKEILSVFKD